MPPTSPLDVRVTGTGRPPSTRTALIGLGGNLGNRAQTLQAAVRALSSVPGLRPTAVSPMYETPPVQVAVAPGDPPPQDFLNVVLRAETTLGGKELLGHLLRIEREAGRESKGDHRSRTLDLDLLALGDVILIDPTTPRLSIPHPRLHRRWFVLKPMADVAPEWRHPQLNDATTSELLAALGHARRRRGRDRPRPAASRCAVVADAGRLNPASRSPNGCKRRHVGVGGRDARGARCRAAGAVLPSGHLTCPEAPRRLCRPIRPSHRPPTGQRAARPARPPIRPTRRCRS
jgi:2-amino-4-hydroxy-6-hydroxymethyldihydropteridine diphosphokinase